MVICSTEVVRRYRYSSIVQHTLWMQKKQIQFLHLQVRLGKTHLWNNGDYCLSRIKNIELDEGLATYGPQAGSFLLLEGHLAYGELSLWGKTSHPVCYVLDREWQSRLSRFTQSLCCPSRCSAIQTFSNDIMILLGSRLVVVMATAH